jgi:hypothetical protein
MQIIIHKCIDRIIYDHGEFKAFAIVRLGMSLWFSTKFIVLLSRPESESNSLGTLITGKRDQFGVTLDRKLKRKSLDFKYDHI